MVVSIERWNGRDLQDTTYEAVIDNPSLFTRQGTPVQVQPPGAWATHIRTEQRARALQFIVKVISGDLNTAQRQLQEWFAIGTEAELEILEDGTAKVIDAVCVGFARYEPFSSAFTVSLVAPDPRWRSVNPISSASLITSSGGGFTVYNRGNTTVDDAVITIRPVSNKAAANGWLYKSESVIANRAARALGTAQGSYALELTEGWDHATEVGASRSQSDADDVRAVVDGVETPRWLGEHANNDANSAATKVWVNGNYSPRRTAVLLTAMTVASPTEGGDVEVTKGGTLGWPRQGALLIDDEVILYSGRTENNANGRAAFTGVIRGARNTTVATHSASTTMYWVEHRPQIVYGHTGASAPDSRSDLKPMLDLTSSTVSNERFEWLNFADSAYPGRSMQWLTRSRTFDDQYDKILAPTASPLTALTWEYQSGGAVAGKPVGNTYYIDLPTGTGSSGGNVASLTRVLADTLGMWVEGIDDAGQVVNLQKFAGALTSASANITAPTNPVYRLECWVFNQVVMRGLPPGYTGISGYNALGVGTATTDGTQFVGGADAIDLVGAGALINSATAGRTVTLSLSADNGSNVPVNGPTFTPTITTVIGNVFGQGVLTDPIVIQPAVVWWVTAYVDGGADTYWLSRAIPSSRRSRHAATNYVERTHDLVLYGRPNAVAATFSRLNDNAVADDADQATVDGVTVHLSSTESPYVALKSRQSIYRFVNGTLYNETTGQSITINTVCKVGDELRIAIGDGIAVNIDEELGESFAQGVEYSDPDGKFVLAPGYNALRFVESGMTGVNVSVDARACWE